MHCFYIIFLTIFINLYRAETNTLVYQTPNAKNHYSANTSLSFSVRIFDFERDFLQGTIFFYFLPLIPSHFDRN